MKRKLRIAMVFSLGLLSANLAMANDAVLGALLGGGAGAVVGRSIGGRNGTVIGGALGAAAGAAIGSSYRSPHVENYSPSPVYYAPPAYSHQQVYYTRPVRVQQRPVYYVQNSFYRDGRKNHHYHDRSWDRHDRGSRR